MVGGGGGDHFEDSTTTKPLIRVHVRHAQRIDRVECEYIDGSRAGAHGGSGGKTDYFELNDKEAIISVWIWAGTLVDAIQFQTSHGRLSKKFGGGGGAPTLFRGHENGKERALMGFRGRSAKEIDNLEPIWSPTQQLDKAHVVLGDFKGGADGVDFNMLDNIGISSLKTNLRAITVSCVNVGITGIECHLSDNKSSGFMGMQHSSSRFDLGDGERITRIEGREGDLPTAGGKYISALRFFTSKGRSSPQYGPPDDGEPFTWRPPYESDASAATADMSLLCFAGSTAKSVLIGRLAPVWVTDPPVKWSLKIDHFDDQAAHKYGAPTEAYSKNEVIENDTSEPVKSTFKWATEVERRTTMTLSSESRTMLGGKVTAEFTAKGKAGVPFVTEGEVEAKAGVEAGGEQEWTSSLSDEQSWTTKHTLEATKEYTCPPRKRIVGTCKTMSRRLEGVPWTGKMIVTYAGGSTREIPVKGTLESANFADHTYSFKEEELR